MCARKRRSPMFSSSLQSCFWFVAAHKLVFEISDPESDADQAMTTSPKKKRKRRKKKKSHTVLDNPETTTSPQ
ncbi:hypothetical protein BJ912DRAFT_1000311, partial [Pholiota molesta]